MELTMDDIITVFNHNDMKNHKAHKQNTSYSITPSSAGLSALAI